MNKIHLIGNVVHTPEMRSTQSGMSVCKFSVAVKRRFKNPQTGDYDTDFFEVQAWRQLADLCGKFLERGRKVAVVGAMQMRDYEAKDGSKRRAWEVIADEVEFLSQRTESASDAPAADQRQPMTREQAKAMVKQAAAAASATPEQQGFTVADDDELPF